MLLEAAPTLRHDDRFEVGVQLPSLLTKSPVRHRLLRKELLLDLLPVPDREALLSSVESFGEEMCDLWTGRSGCIMRMGERDVPR